MLTFHEGDLAVQLKLANLALAEFEAAGYVERQAVVTSNLGIAYGQLGLYRRARREYVKAGDIYRRIGAHVARLNLDPCRWREAEIAMGRLDSARSYAAESSRNGETLANSARCGQPRQHRTAALALLGGDASDGAAPFRARAAARARQRSHRAGDRRADVRRARPAGAGQCRAPRWQPRGRPPKCTARTTWRRSTGCRRR